MSVLLLTNDLLGSSQISGAAARADVGLDTAATSQQVSAACQSHSYHAVIVDLATPGVKIDTLLADLRQSSNPPGIVVAFGPHVHETMLESARKAGCDEVYSRGRFHAGMDGFFARFAENS